MTDAWVDAPDHYSYRDAYEWQTVPVDFITEEQALDNHPTTMLD
jgi:hypothetical protein